ncbi:hypothetical protein [Aquimarina rubra]|uniref:CRISPR type III-B/RAMP module-associated protein Cmr5 n=1 Tax=Aquimarina rubra TaxID=1920033 RepID=A0ABW5LM02_9FLAO
MSTIFSVMVKEFVADGSKEAIPNPARSGYLCMPTDFLGELVRFISMMQVMKVGVGSEIAQLKKDLKVANQFLREVKTQQKLYATTVQAIDRLEQICIEEGEKAQENEEITLAETYAWCIAGCQLFLEYTKSKK